MKTLNECTKNNKLFEFRHADRLLGMRNNASGSASGIGSAFSYTSPQQVGTLFYPNALTFTISAAPPASGDVTLDIFAFGDLDAVHEYLSISGGATGGTRTAQGDAFDFSTAVGQYAGGVQDTLSILQADWNSWVMTGSVDIVVTPSNNVTNLFNNPDEYAFISVGYETRATAVPEPATLALSLTGIVGLLMMRRRKTR